MRSKLKLLMILIFLSLSILQFQNCTNSNVKFFDTNRETLSSRVGGGDIYDGKPADGNYCRIFDNMTCPANAKNLQGMARVNNLKVQLIEDNCTSTTTTFLTSDAAVSFTPLAENYIGITRGIFKKCDVDQNGLPLPLTEMPEVYCTTANNQISVVVNKNLATQNLELNLSLAQDGKVRLVQSEGLQKSLTSNNIKYTSPSFAFDLNIAQSTSQTLSGNLSAKVDNSLINISMDCRQANSSPTIIVEQDLEISTTWIDTTNLAGYWKLNEITATENSQILDSSKFKYDLTLLTGSDGINKRNASVQGGAFDFDGNDYIRRSTPADGHLDFDTRSFSYMTWMKKTAHAGQWDMLIWKGGNCATCPGFEMQCGSSGCAANISDGDGGPVGQSIVPAYFATDSSVLFGRWVHLAVVVDRNTQTLRSFVDGALIEAKDISAVGSVTTTIRDFQIGSGLGGSWSFLGSLDDVAVWNEALSDAKIKMIYERLRPKFK